MSRSIVGSMERDHERLLDIAGRLDSATRGRERLANQFRTLWLSHLRAETAIACRVVGHSGYASVEQRALPALDDCAAGASDPRCLSDLQVWLADHITDAHQHVIARLHAESGEARLEQLGAAYEHRRAVEARALRPVRRTPRRLDRPRTELYEQARRVGIAGRAAMTREQLIEALQQAAPG